MRRFLTRSRAPAKPAPHASARPAQSLALLLASISLVLVPHLIRLPWWLSAIAIGLIGWRAWATRRNERLPRKPLLMVCVAAGIFAIYTHFQSLLGRDAGVAMLVLFLGLKLLETRHERDAVVVAFLAYFLLLANFFYTQTPWAGMHAAVCSVALAASLVSFNAPSQHWRHHFKTGGVLLAAGLPIAALLFVLFPRFDGPLWTLSSLRNESMVGLSETMSPGEISRLSQSDAIAFRARFDEAIPPRSALYWRGPVLVDFDGRTWRPSAPTRPPAYQVRPLGRTYGYEVTLEPHERDWLFALEMATLLPDIARPRSDYQLVSQRPVRTRLRYKLRSALDYQAPGGSSHPELRAALALPEGYNPRSIELAREWRQQLRSDTAIIERALAFFLAEGITYTTRPPTLGRHSVDEFLFDTRQGFCEHFSAAFVVMMRAANIPARVVTGYQGGTANPYDANIVVRQADAHAWTEVWIEGVGWKRVDPTAAAAPARVEHGLAAAVPQTDPLPFMLRPGMELFASFRLRMEAMIHYWNQWVLGYSAARQRDLLSRIGMPTPDVSSITRALLVALGGVMLVVLVLILRERGPADPAQRAWLRACAELARLGTVRHPTEGPAAFAARASNDHPALAAAIGEVAGLYVSLRYGRIPERGAHASLDRAVRSLRARARGSARLLGLGPFSSRPIESHSGQQH